MIAHLTHTPEGTPIQSLEVGLRVAIGLPADEEAGRKAPVKLDHFIFQVKNAKGDWVESKQVTEKIREIYGLKKDEPIRKIRVFFTTDDIEEAFRTNLEWWSRSELKCRGNGLMASRSINVLSDEMKKKYPGERYVPWTPCGAKCPDFIRKKDGCKPSGDLTFVLQDLPKLGSMCGFFTTSKRSIAQIFSSLHQIAELTRGKIKLIPFEMVLKGGKTRYQDAAGASKTGSAFFVNLEMRDTDQDQLLTRLQEHATKFDRMMAESDYRRPALTEGGKVNLLPPIERIPEKDKALIMTSEFTSDDDTEHGAPGGQPPGEHEDDEGGKGPEQTAETQQAIQASDEDEKVFTEFCAKIELSGTRRDAVLAKLGGDFGEARKFAEKFSQAIAVLELSNDKAMEYLGKGVGGSFEDMFSYFDREIKKKQKADKAAEKKAAAEPKPPETAAAEPKAEIPEAMKGW